MKHAKKEILVNYVFTTQHNTTQHNTTQHNTTQHEMKNFKNN